MEAHSERIDELQVKNSKYQRELKNHRGEVSDLRSKLEKAESKVYTCKISLPLKILITCFNSSDERNRGQQKKRKRSNGESAASFRRQKAFLTSH